MSRCKCGEMLSTYDMTRKSRIQLEDGQIIEIYEDLCSKCRSEPVEYGEEVGEELDYILEE